MREKKIIVFDSGIGGFSILKRILEEKIPVSILYLCDQAYFPYGSKSEDWLATRLETIAAWSRSFAPDAFVLACNTGTVSGIESVRNMLACPVVGVEPVVKPLSSYERALILGTQATVNSARTQELRRRYGPHLSLFTPSKLATAIENNDMDQVKKSLEQISEIIARENIQAIGLSCTHYPLIQKRFEKKFPGVHFYDPSQAVVMRLIQVLSLDVAAPVSRSPDLTFYTTGTVLRFNKQLRKYFGESYRGEKVDI